MMFTSLKTAAQSRRGSALAITLVLLAIVSFTLLTLARNSQDHQRLNKRKYDLSRAYYLAEGGVAQVIHWGNFPGDFHNPNLFVRVDPETLVAASEDTVVDASADPGDLFPALDTALSSGNFPITKSDLYGMGMGTCWSEYGYEVAYIEDLELIPSDPSDPINCFFKVRSVGRTPSGRERTVLAYMNVSPIIAIRIPAGLISNNVAAVFGNARIHWGEAWSKNDFAMLNKSQMNYLVPTDSNYDPWAIYRTEGYINFPGNWQWGIGADLFDASSQQPGAVPASGDYELAFHQGLTSGTLNFPTLDYQEFKDLATAHGRYYSTDAAGNVYRDGIEDAAHLVDFMDEFGVADRGSAPFDLVFIDTIDGQPPAADGSNLATIAASGTGLGLKGVYWMGANFDASGVGSPPSLVADDPDTTSHSLGQIFCDGVLYAAGTMALSGNAGVYGSAIAQRGMTGGGTPDIYFNHLLADGLILDNGNVGSVFKISMQKNY